MGSRLKNLFFGKSSNSTSSKRTGKTTGTQNRNLKGSSYENAVARDPPVKGSYPVAGNGPSVLEEIQRSRAHRDNLTRRDSTTSGSIAAAPNVPRYRDDPIQRPRTAPHNGQPGGGYTAITGNGDANTHGRTRSGFSMKSPPSFLVGKRKSTHSTTGNSIQPSIEPLPPIPSSTPKPATRDVKTYQPKKGNAETPDYTPFTPLYAQHNRTASQASHRSHVDLLDAHSNIRPSRETSRHRAKASGVRNYGEDVADRNIAGFGGKEREPRLDLNSPEFSYLKTVYSPKKRFVAGESHSRTSSALGHVLGHEDSDDIQIQKSNAKAPSSIRSTTASRQGVAIPSRNDASSVISYTTSRAHDDDRPSNVSNAQRGRAMSPLSRTTASIYEEETMPDTLAKSKFTRAVSTPPIPARGREPSLKEPPPVAPAAALHKSNPSITNTSSSIVPITSTEVIPTSAPTKRRQRNMSSGSFTNGSKSRNGSVSYSAFPNTSRRESQSEENGSRSPPLISKANKRQGMIIEGAKEPPSLEGIVDLTNTVDTDVVTKTLPAVNHEYVTPQRHEIREERITREIHTHDVFHRILPVVDTEILPTKHYIKSPDGKSLIEIPESEVPQHTITGTGGNWGIVHNKLGNGRHPSVIPRKALHGASASHGQSISQSSIYSHANIDEDDGADGPVIGLARGEPISRSRANSRASTKSISRAKTALEPILSSKKEYITKEGHPKTEYVWRHPPVFEDALGRTQPVYIGAGLGDLSSPSEFYSDEEEDIEGANFGAMREGKSEEGLLFRDSGYGSQGMLPGLAERVPVADFHTLRSKRDMPAIDGKVRENFQNFDHRENIVDDSRDDFEKAKALTNGQSCTYQNGRTDSSTPRYGAGDWDEKIRLGKVVGDVDGHDEIGTVRIAGNAEGEATKALRRMRERRSSATSSAGSSIDKGKGRMIEVPGVLKIANEMNRMHV